MKDLANQIAGWLRERLDAAGAAGFVCGLSGGVDSATAAALAVREGCLPKAVDTDALRGSLRDAGAIVDAPLI